MNIQREKLSTIFIGLISVLFILPLAAESGDNTLDPSKIKLSELDLSEAELFFEGPVELYLSNIQYRGSSYAAVLEYDGVSTIDLRVPKSRGRGGKPRSIDLSGVSLSLEERGVVVKGLSVDDTSYQGTFAFRPEESEFVLKAVRKNGKSLDQNEIRSLKHVISRQEGRIEELETDIERKDSTIISLNSKLRKMQNGAQTDFEEIRRRLSRPIHSGFSSGSDHIWGQWSLEESDLTQGDGENYYAKYSIPLLQSNDEYLYSFRASTKEEGWAGYGLHFLASEVEAADRYLYGSSYLVWVTRDYRHNATERTFVELYRSNGDEKMIRLVSEAVYEDINEKPKISIHSSRPEKRITVYANGQRVFSFEDKRMLREGDMVALRSFGEASFSEFTVHGR